MSIWIVKLDWTANGDAIVNLPEELLDDLCWEVGDDIQVEVEPNLIRLDNPKAQSRQKTKDHSE